MREIVTAVDALLSIRSARVEVDMHRLCCEAARRGGEYVNIVTAQAAADWLVETGEVLDGVEVKEEAES